MFPVGTQHLSSMHHNIVKFSFRFSVFVVFWSLLCLTPLYKRAGNSIGWNQFTLANIPNDPSSTALWAPAIFAYIFSGYFCYLLFVEYKNFVQKRTDYLVQGNHDTPPQTYYTILLEKIPTDLRSEPQLREFFEKIFPGLITFIESWTTLTSKQVKSTLWKLLLI